MPKNTTFIKFFGIIAFIILFFMAIAEAAQYYDQYPGSGFLPEVNSLNYFRDNWEGAILHNDTSDAVYICPVNFNVPDGSAYFIKSIGIRYWDIITNGQISVFLKKKNLYTGAGYTVASWNSGVPDVTSGVQTVSKGTISGTKLVDTKKFSYWLYVYFFVDGNINPYTDLILYQVRIHYGT